MTVVLKREGFERVETIDSYEAPSVITKVLDGRNIRFHLQHYDRLSDRAVYSAA